MTDTQFSIVLALGMGALLVLLNELKFRWYWRQKRQQAHPTLVDKLKRDKSHR